MSEAEEQVRQAATRYSLSVMEVLDDPDLWVDLAAFQDITRDMADRLSDHGFPAHSAHRLLVELVSSCYQIEEKAG